ncbi:MAG: hydroxylamine reductase [Thermoleophilia bacterium]|nr:hydroxylamine reductase [Thermoleophilia bacterium]
MFCYQCEQTARSVACTVKGVCGKEDQVAALQDALVYALKGLALAIERYPDSRSLSRDIYHKLATGLFVTLTNVNFDPVAVANWVHEVTKLRDSLKDELVATNPSIAFPEAPANFVPAERLEELADQGREHGINNEASRDPNIRSLQHTVLYGLKGIAAYAHHAAELGYHDEQVDRFLVQALCDLSRFQQGDLGAWVDRALRVGEINYKTMALLDRANTETFGVPVPTAVPLGVKKGKAILVSGHDFQDLQAILEQSQEKGITVYTHGEMLPAHAYPKLKAYPHLYGNWGTAWQNQKKEFPEFPGAILVTTNCIQIPLDTYKDNVFTSTVVGVPNARHIEGRDFSAVIERALELPGFPADAPGKTVQVGFMRNAVLEHAESIIALVKAGKIRHFFLVGGCDGAKPGRDYYTRFVELTPPDTIVLTLACGKYRFYDKDLGTIEGIPRLLDMGQCNDAYSAVQVALALAEAFGVNVNELPLSLILSWYEQKAVAILLSLLSLGIKNIRLGPTLPAFLTPDVTEYIVKNFDLKLITTPEEDLKAILG